MNEAAVVTTCYVHATNSSFNFLFSEIPMQFDLGIIEKKTSLGNPQILSAHKLFR